jgi:alpha-L-arabinofuranosidase
MRHLRRSHRVVLGPRRSLALAILPGLLLGLGTARAVHAQLATSSISVDFENVTRAVPTYLFGQNLQAIDNGEGIIREDGDFESQIVELLSEARITTLRYPGGTAADYFHWWQALGPISRRPLQSSGYPGEYYKPRAGPEEFIRLSIALRAVPFVTANTGTGSAAEAAELAKFFNARGFPVSFWEVGNEIYFEGIDENGRIGLPPDVYAQRVIEYASAIRAVAPYAKIFAAGVIGPEEQDSYWNELVLGLAGSYIDGISVHNTYYPLYGVDPNGVVPSDDYLFTAMLGATKAVDRTLTVLENQLIKLGRLIPIYVTEYDGIFFPDETVEDPSRTYLRNPTLGSALFNASVLNLFMRHKFVHGAHHMSLAGNRFGSLIGTEGGKFFRNPQFYVHREYSREVGNVLVKSVLDPMDALFDSGPVKLVSGQTGVPMLDITATRNPAGTRFNLFVVNRSLTDAVETSLALNLPQAVAASVSVLDGPDVTSRNDLADPKRVSIQTMPVVDPHPTMYTFPPHSLTIFRWSSTGE